MFLSTCQTIKGHYNELLRLSGQISIFGGVFFVFQSLLGIGKQKKLHKFVILFWKTSEPCTNIECWPIAGKSWRLLPATLIHLVRRLCKPSLIDMIGFQPKMKLCMLLVSRRLQVLQTVMTCPWSVQTCRWALSNQWDVWKMLSISTAGTLGIEGGTWLL